MRNFKLHVGIQQIYPIERARYERETVKEFPYYQRNRKGEVVNYAVCPQCDNPIQLIGFYKEIKKPDFPYGKHVSHSINDLAEYDREAYLNCPYSNPQRTIPRETRKAKMDIVARTVYNLMRTQFDRVIYILEKDIDMKISKRLAEAMLTLYVDNQGWLYQWATPNNLPWVFDVMSASRTMYGRLIKNGSELHKRILACEEAEFQGEENGEYLQLASKKGKFLDLHFCFMCHHREINEQMQLIETIDFVITQTVDGRNREVLRQTLLINEKRFLNLICLPEEKSKRNQNLLEIAKELMPEID